MANFRAVLKFGLFLFWCLIAIPPQVLIMLFTKGKSAYFIPVLWHKIICRTFQIQIETIGEISTNKQTIFVGNHVSYLDIPVISTRIPASFVAKQDVEGWPLFGFLAKLQQTAFIDRTRTAAKKGTSNLQARLGDGKSIIIFPEGTSSDGSRILPFKSSLFSIALDLENKPLLQAFTVELVEADGKTAITQNIRDIYAWHGDMTLMPHFWNFAKSKGAKVRLHFHPPLQVKETDNRKELAKTCHDLTASGLQDHYVEAA